MLTKGALTATALALGLAGTVLAQPTVGNVRIDYVSHSEARVRYDLSASACYERARYGLDTNYDKSAGGGIQDFHAGQAWCGQFDIGGQLSGLAPATQYHVCAQASNDGTTWSACVDATFTTLPLPAVHPAPPVLPTWAPPESPSTNGYNVVNVAGDCHDLQSAINQAVASQPANGTVINVPALTVCAGPYQFPNDPQAVMIPSNGSGVDLTTGIFTPSTVPSGVVLTNGQAVQFSTVNGCIPGSKTQGSLGNTFNSNSSCNNNGPINPGNIYYVVNLTGSPTRFQVAATPGGTPLVPGDFGTGGPLLMGLWPPANSNWIVIRTATPDSQFCPPGVRCMGSSWAQAMPKLQVPPGNLNAGFKTGGLTHHIWLTGWEFTPIHMNLSGTADPLPTSGFIFTPGGWGASYFIIDRSYIHGLGFPDRLFRPITEFSGGYMAIMNSDLEKYDYWRPNIIPTGTPGPRGLMATSQGQTLTLTPGTFYLGVATCSVTAPVTWNITGGSSSTAGALYLDLSCNPTLVVPNGITATCSGASCTVVTQATPTYPADSNGGVACGPLFDIPFNAGALGTPSANQRLSAFTAEGNAGLIAGFGPGPYYFSNLYVQGEGLLFHLDDSSSASDAYGITFRRLTFILDQSKRPNGPNSDNFVYSQRNGPELKHGHTILFDGNVFSGFWSEVSGLGCAIVAESAYNQGNSGTPVNGGITDLTITNNTLTNSTCFANFGGGVFNNAPKAPSQRIRIANNVLNSNNGWTQFSNLGMRWGTATPFVPVAGVEDLVIDHNTLYDNRGPDNSWLHPANSAMEGVQITNNIMWFNGDHASAGVDGEGWYGITVPNCSFIGKQMMDCVFTQGVGNPSYTFANNLLVPYYLNSQAPSGNVTPSTLSSVYSGFPGVIIQSGSQPSDRLAGVGFVNPASSNLQLSVNSPYLGKGSDGRDLGANIQQLNAAQGTVRNVRIADVTRTGANVLFAAPDAKGCPVDFSTSENFAGFTRVHGAGGGWKQQVVLEGLKSGTLYHYRVLCEVQQPAGTFTTLP